MNKKMLEIAGIIFALAFVGVFLIAWYTTQSIIQNEVEEINSLYSSDVAFDISLFDNKVVTGSSLLNFAADMAASNSIGTKMLFYDYDASTEEYSLIGSRSDYNDYSSFVSNELPGSVSKDKEYRTYIHYNDNGVADGIAIQG